MPSSQDFSFTFMGVLGENAQIIGLVWHPPPSHSRPRLGNDTGSAPQIEWIHMTNRKMAAGSLISASDV